MSFISCFFGHKLFRFFLREFVRVVLFFRIILEKWIGVGWGWVQFGWVNQLFALLGGGLIEVFLLNFLEGEFGNFFRDWFLNFRWQVIFFRSLLILQFNGVDLCSLIIFDRFATLDYHNFTLICGLLL